ncbi:hypothetical protein C8Q80DRAFT_1314916 [Daedaleopsis nitida]|nr:hypothetical protein C8Q80DRAFT_1314916 [Daedaleopsis nitida]
MARLAILSVVALACAVAVQGASLIDGGNATLVAREDHPEDAHQVSVDVRRRDALGRTSLLTEPYYVRKLAVNEDYDQQVKEILTGSTGNAAVAGASAGEDLGSASTTTDNPAERKPGSASENASSTNSSVSEQMVTRAATSVISSSVTTNYWALCRLGPFSVWLGCCEYLWIMTSVIICSGLFVKSSIVCSLLIGFNGPFYI